MIVRRLRRPATALGGLLAALVLCCSTAPDALAGPAVPAQRGVVVTCPSPQVTVVVLGAGKGCATGPGSGLEALRQAGFSYAFVPRQQGMICQIDGSPNPCNGAPGTAYWSYWLWTGSRWAYSDFGAGNRTPPPGSVEGWAFGGYNASSAPPLATPTAPAPPTTALPTTAAPAAPTTAPAAPTTPAPTAPATPAAPAAPGAAPAGPPGRTATTAGKPTPTGARPTTGTGTGTTSRTTTGGTGTTSGTTSAADPAGTAGTTSLDLPAGQSGTPNGRSGARLLPGDPVSDRPGSEAGSAAGLVTTAAESSTSTAGTWWGIGLGSLAIVGLGAVGLLRWRRFSR